jgi:hypothetical protein
MPRSRAGRGLAVGHDLHKGYHVSRDQVAEQHVKQQFAVRPPCAVGEPGEVSRAGLGYEGVELAAGTLHLGMYRRQVRRRNRHRNRCPRVGNHATTSTGGARSSAMSMRFAAPYGRLFVVKDFALIIFDVVDRLCAASVLGWWWVREWLVRRAGAGVSAGRAGVRVVPCLPSRPLREFPRKALLMFVLLVPEFGSVLAGSRPWPCGWPSASLDPAAGGAYGQQSGNKPPRLR